MVPFHWTKCKIRPILNVYSFFRDAKQKILYSLKTFYYKHKKKIWTRKVRRFLQVRSLEQSKIYINLKTLNVMLGRWTIFTVYWVFPWASHKCWRPENSDSKTPPWLRCKKKVVLVLPFSSFFFLPLLLAFYFEIIFSSVPKLEQMH